MTRLSLEEQARLMREAEEHGLYRRELERDACGMGFVANLKGTRSHDVVEQGIAVLENLSHRGATGCDPCTGDGAGILVQVPDRFLRAVTQKLGFELPEAGKYGVGMLFMPMDPKERKAVQAVMQQAIEAEGATLLGSREVPVDPKACGDIARESLPFMLQIFVTSPAASDAVGFERSLYVLRRCIENAVKLEGLGVEGGFYVCSLSARTVVYKGLLMPEQMKAFYRDLGDPRFESAIAMVHSRFSTNTFPSWPRAHPYRYICHNGEINTLRGNLNWMRAREKQFVSTTLPDVTKILPVCTESGSDSESFDNALELLVQTGRSLPHSVMMMIPEAWQEQPAMSFTKRAFYEYHACLMEPWDGPASIAFTDGTVVGAVLDRNGLRPSRYYVTTDDLVVMASEVGVLDIPPEKIVQKARLEPGRMFLVDTAQGRIVDDRDVKETIAARHPYRTWLQRNLVRLRDLPEPDMSRLPPELDHDTLLLRQRVHGYTREDVRLLIRPMAQTRT